MKKILIIILLLFIIVLGLYLTFFLTKKEIPEPLPTTRSLNMKVVMLVNQVQLIRGNKTVPVKVGQLLQEEDQLVTGPSSAVEIKLDETFNILIRENSFLNLKTLKKVYINGERQNSFYSFFMHKGKAFVNLNPLEKNSTWNLKTPTLAIGVRGTRFVVQAETGQSEVKVREGQIEALRNIKAPDDYQQQLSARVNPDEKLTISQEENLKVQEMIEAKKMELPKLTKEKVARDSDFQYLDSYFSLKSTPLGGRIQVVGTRGLPLYLNGTFMGNGDLVRFLEPGTYDIRVESEFQIFRTTFTLEQGEDKTIEVQLKDKELPVQDPGRREGKAQF
jgi:hypothetical protein